jgi:hypothetical protein
MIDGFFRIAFTGAAGSGFGVLVFRQGSVAGADVGGATYDGTYSENPATGEINFKVNMAAPAGIAPVQTGVALTAPMDVPIAATLKSNDITSQKTVLLQTPLGPVNVIFSKIRDIH